MSHFFLLFFIFTLLCFFCFFLFKPLIAIALMEIERKINDSPMTPPDGVRVPIGSANPWTRDRFDFVTPYLEHRRLMFEFDEDYIPDSKLVSSCYHIIPCPSKNSFLVRAKDALLSVPFYSSGKLAHGVHHIKDSDSKDLWKAMQLRAVLYSRVDDQDFFLGVEPRSPEVNSILSGVKVSRPPLLHSFQSVKDTWSMQVVQNEWARCPTVSPGGYSEDPFPFAVIPDSQLLLTSVVPFDAPSKFIVQIYDRKRDRVLSRLSMQQGQVNGFSCLDRHLFLAHSEFGAVLYDTRNLGIVASFEMHIDPRCPPVALPDGSALVIDPKNKQLCKLDARNSWKKITTPLANQDNMVPGISCYGPDLVLWYPTHRVAFSMSVASFGV